MIPCNTLSPLANQIGYLLASEADLREFARTHSEVIPEAEQLRACNVSVHTVPAAVTRHLQATTNIKFGDSVQARPLLVIGTSDTNAFYALLTDPRSFEIVPLTSSEYELIDKAVVASIGGDPQQVDSCRDELKRELIGPLESQYAGLVVLEACTDFHLGLGVSSLELFAEAMVADCYRL